MLKLNKEVLNGSIILLLAFSVYSFLNFAYQFAMTRMLEPSEYGLLAALFSIVYISIIFSDSIQTIITKYCSVEKEKGKIKNLFKRFLRKAVYFSFAIYVFFLIGAIFLSKVWKAPYLLIALTGMVIFTSLLLPISRGIMQGKKMFKALGFSLVGESLIKLFIAVILVFLGLKVFGAISALVISMFLALAVSMDQIKIYLDAKEKFMKTNSIYSQSLLIFVFTLAVTLFYSIDNMIARAVFSPEMAGYYAIASILGKIVFWGTQPISRAMLPIASDGRKAVKDVFKSSLIILSILVVLSLFVFYQFPELVVKIFSGKELKEASNILFKIGIAMSLLAYSNLMLIYRIALTKESKDTLKNKIFKLAKKALFFGAIIGIEIILLMFSKGSLESFANGLVMGAILFFFGSIILLIRTKKN